MRRTVLPPHCPLHNNIPDWLRKVLRVVCKGHETSQMTNTFPEAVDKFAHRTVCGAAP